MRQRNRRFRGAGIIHRSEISNLKFKILNRCGYTLVEILVALALSVVLLTCVYGSLRFYYQMTDAGRLQVEEAQVSRAIVRRVEVDLASLVFVEPDNSDSSGGQAADDTASGSASNSTSTTSGSSAGGSGSTGGSSGSPTGGQSGSSGGQGGSSGGSGSTGTTTSSSSSTSTNTAATSSTTGHTGMNVGLTGDSQTLVLHISRPSRDLDYAGSGSTSSIADRRSDLQSVSYFLASRGSGALAGMVAELASPELDAPKIAGLARLEGDQMSIVFADSSSNVDEMAGIAEIIAPEVIALQFRYFDGSAWYDSWDSQSTARLPLAVEITMGFEIPPNPREEKLRRRSREQVVGRTIRQVIGVPMAVPYVPGVTD
jgi:prepilin-type N-terminal cleavage/methylation domain-containing protein